MCFNWFGSSTTAERINFGSLAVIAPILEQMDLAGILDRHLPQDPQAEFSVGSILSLLVAARLSNPVALVNVADWAQHKWSRSDLEDSTRKAQRRPPRARPRWLLLPAPLHPRQYCSARR